MQAHRLRGVILVAVVVATTFTACGGTSRLAGDARPTTAPERDSDVSAAEVDPQILSDVAAGAFPLPGPTQRRTIRVTLASIGLPNVACGGENFANFSDTSFRFDQAHYADLELIGQKGLTEPEFKQPPRADEQCRAAKTPSFRHWYMLGAAWRDATLTAANSAPVVATHARTTACLQHETGLDVDAGDPTLSFLNAVDYALSGMKSLRKSRLLERRFSLAYAECTRSYFAALGAQLRPVKARLVERNRELLQQYASELAALGYVP